jgi:hypothetical protein
MARIMSSWPTIAENGNVEAIGKVRVREKACRAAKVSIFADTLIMSRNMPGKKCQHKRTFAK